MGRGLEKRQLLRTDLVEFDGIWYLVFGIWYLVLGSVEAQGSEDSEDLRLENDAQRQDITHHDYHEKRA
jgi:hypothetical protein